MEYLCYQLHGRIIGVVLIMGIKEAQLFQIFKFVYLVIRLAVDIHLDLVPFGRRYAAGFFCLFQHLLVLFFQTAFCLSL